MKRLGTWLLTASSIALLLMAAAVLGVMADESIFALRLGDDLPFVEVDEGSRLTILLISDGNSQCIAMPPGATFDGATGRLTWVPDFDQKGIHSIVFIGSIDGKEEESFVTITVHDNNWKPDASTAVSDPQFLWAPNNKLVLVDIIVKDPLGNRVPVTVQSVTVVDILRRQYQEETMTGPNKNAPGQIKKINISLVSRTAQAKKGLEYLFGQEGLYLLASRPGYVSSRIYEAAFTVVHPKTGMSDSGIIKVPVLHDMSDLAKERQDQGSEESDEIPKVDSEKETVKEKGQKEKP